MNVMQPPAIRLFVLWWSIMWRCVVYGFSGAIVVSIILGVALGLMGASKETMTQVGEIAGVAVGVTACLYAGWSRLGRSLGAPGVSMFKGR